MTRLVLVNAMLGIVLVVFVRWLVLEPLTQSVTVDDSCMTMLQGYPAPSGCEHIGTGQ